MTSRAASEIARVECPGAHPQARAQVAALPPAVARALMERGALPRTTQSGAMGSGAEGEAPDRRLETALMVLFRDTGWNAAFNALYAATCTAVQAWIVKLLATRRQEADVLELVQDTYFNVYRYAGGFRDARGNSFRGWARTIAANVVRRAAMRRAACSWQAMPEGLQEPQDQRAGPDQQLALNEQRARLRRAWTLLLLHYAAAYEQLSERDRAALAMVEVEGLGYAEAGRRLRVGRSNMKMIMFRARRRIRGHILRAMGGASAAEATGPSPGRAPDPARAGDRARVRTAG